MTVRGPGKGRVPTHREPDRPPPLPFLPGEVGNGEFVPAAPTERDRLIVRETLALAEEAARRVGMDRRRFLQTTGGMAAMLATINAVAACGASNEGAPRQTAPGTAGVTGSGSTTTSGSAPLGPGGTFAAPPPTDQEACDVALGSQGEFIVDIHTHHVMPGGPWERSAPDIAAMIRPLAPPQCLEADRFDCLDRQHYLQDMFLASDTTVAMLSDVPSSGPADSPIPFADQVGTRDFAATLTNGGQPRVLVQSIIAPNFYERSQYQDQMSAQVDGGQVSTFKVYTAWGPGRQGYALDDPNVGLPAVEHARSLGIKVIAAHKGLPIQGFDQRFNGPRDVVAVAKQYPDMQFIVFHSAFERETTEGPYDATRALRGTSSLLKAMDDLAMPPNSNVWCELGTTWRETMANPTQAAHVVGKLLSRMGEDRVLWGTDAIWYGSPQPQIMAFRAFEITVEFQERFGYPALTPELKAKVFGLNAARLLQLDPLAQRCGVDASRLGEARTAFRALHDAGEIVEPWPARAPLTRRQMLTWLRTDRSATLAPF
jgi:hypothetical protein